MIKQMLKDLTKLKNADFADWSKKLLNVKKGAYAQNDVVWGIKVPQIRNITKKYSKVITLEETENLLKSRVHEVRFASLLILIKKYKSAPQIEKLKIVKLYLKNSRYINNWDLVDLSCYKITGHYWYNYSLEGYWEFAKSKNLWKQRIAIVSTLYFIKHGRFDEILKLSELLLNHKHNLIHKAVGWMLREVGKQNKQTLTSFLDKYSSLMPKIMLRYSIEKISLQERKYYLDLSKKL
ncbi:DNA alkylation repair protein [Candidatus Endomicrobiellum cubanum]|jgi:3-methyladenine DNA glycosylase AlkD|uniref:DNA alkylation repair protein n=1 Tax=Candidatus Endomicrobiellum cubanum TaxID=3242325 RepID=UPI0035930C15